jgi:hypothetical protein
MNITDANLDLIVSVDLNHDADGTPVYQFVYGSQLYATLFGVFAKFAGAKDANAYYVHTVSLKLLNYQGAVNIGFTEHTLRYKVELGIPSITFGVQGTSVVLTKEFKFTSPIKVEKGQRFFLVFNRILYPMPNFGVSPQTSIPGSQRPNAIPHTPCFDSEFHYRNGEQYYDNVLRPGMFRYEGISMEEDDDKFMPSGRCHKSDVTLFY